MKKKKALVTGACGFVGSYMVDLLLDKGYDVIGTDLSSASKDYVNPKAEFIASDLTDRDTLAPLFEGKNIDELFHIAALFDYEAPWELIRKVNVDGTENLFSVALENQCKRVVMLSTVSVYGGAPPEELPVKEDNIMRPGTNYERSKYLQELVARDYMEKGLDITIIRPCPIYGPRNIYGFASMLLLMSKFPVIPMPTTINAHSASVHVTDVVGSMLFVVDKKESIGEAYNITDDTFYEAAEMLKFGAKELGIVVLDVYIPFKLVYESLLAAAKASRWVGKKLKQRPVIEQDMIYYLQFDYQFDNSKIKRLGYQLKYPDIKGGLKETFQWYFDNNIIDENKMSIKIKKAIDKVIVR